MKNNIKILMLVIMISSITLGCVGQSNLTITAPESMEVPVLEKKTIDVELLPVDADANNVVVNLIAPLEISLDPKSKEFKTLVKDQRFNISFNFTVASAGDYRLLIDARASNANPVNRTINISTFIPAPTLEIGEFWVYNQTKGDEPGLHVSEVVRKEFWENKEHYVVKEAWEGEPNGTYKLTYIGVNDLSASKIEYYEDGSLMRSDTVEMNPPTTDYAFPLKIGKRWSWSGVIFGFGHGEISSELSKKENVTAPAGTYVGYYIKHKMTFPGSTNNVELWYVPELKGPAKVSMSVVLKTAQVIEIETSQEIAMELLEHGMPPSKPNLIQIDTKVPAGYETYRAVYERFRIAWPSNWHIFSFSPADIRDYYLDVFIYGADMIEVLYPTRVEEPLIIVGFESIKLRDLEEYKESKLNSLRMRFPWIKISDPEPIELNKRKGYNWVWENPVSGAKGKITIFVVGGYGFMVGFGSSATDFKLYEHDYENILSTFFIKGRPKPRYN